MTGVVEKAIQEVETQARIMMSALRSRLKVEKPWNDPLALWLVEYAAVLINIYREGRGGKTPMERLRGMKHERPVAEYGENILYMPLGDRPAFPEPRFQEGGHMVGNGTQNRRGPGRNPEWIDQVANSEKKA